MAKANKLGMPSRGIPNNMCRDKHMKSYTQPSLRRRKKKTSIEGKPVQTIRLTFLDEMSPCCGQK